jgi:hypothetical protein
VLLPIDPVAADDYLYDKLAPYVVPAAGSCSVRNWHPDEPSTTKVAKVRVRAMAVKFA